MEFLIPRKFGYYSPSSLSETLAFLQKYGKDAKILAGGQSLVPVMKLRLASPKYIVDINHLKDLSYIKESGSTFRIGAATTHHSIERSVSLNRNLQIMSETASLIGDPQVRNCGTIGGSLVHSDPAADWGATIIALRANMKIASSKGTRLVGSDKFFVDTLVSAIKQNELLTEVQIKASGKGSGGAYLKLERKTGDFATVGVAAQMNIGKGDVCREVGIGLASVHPKSVRASKAEAILRNNVVTENLISEAAAAASEEVNPSDDPLRGSAEFKRDMVRVFTERALKLATKRTRGKV